MKYKRLFAVLLVIALSLYGCSDEKQGKNISENHVIRIGMSFDSLVIERWIRDRDAFIKYAKDHNAEVNVQNANGDKNEQIRQIEYFINEGVDAIVVIPVDCYDLSDVIQKAEKAGIKVISYDRLIQNANVDLYISFDNERVGSLMAENLMANIPAGGNVIKIKGSTRDENVKLVNKGFDDAIKGGKLNVIYEADCENWEADQAVEYMEEALKKNDNISGIMCGNDDIAARVCQVLSEHRKAGQVVVVGQDADLSACQRIVEGTQSMTVYKMYENMAEIAGEFAIEMIQGKDITDSDLSHYATETISDGDYDVPYYKLDPVAVTKGNMDSVIIDSGFHDKADVYLNVIGR